MLYTQEDFNEKIVDIQEKLDNLKLEQAKYNQSKEIKTKQIVSILRTLRYYIYHFNTSDQREKPVYKCYIAHVGVRYRKYHTRKCVI